MVRPRVDPVLEGRILQLLADGNSERLIVKKLKTENIKISKSLIQNIKNRHKNPKKSQENKAPKKPSLRKLTRNDLKKLDKWTNRANPPTQKHMARALKVTQQTISKHINKTLNKKKRIKPKVHAISERNIETRKVRSLGFYKLLNKGKWKKIITTDEAWFRITKINGQRRIQYVKRTTKNPKLERFCRQESFAKGFMVWSGISYNGKTSLHFVRPNTKVNSQYYCETILKKFLARDARKLYPNGDFVFHQDSAPSHVSKWTQEWMNPRLRYIHHTKWIPNSPDAAPMDYFVWGYLKNKLESKKINDTAALKRALKKAWKELPQELINRALDSWPRRVHQIYKNKGLHIE